MASMSSWESSGETKNLRLKVKDLEAEMEGMNLRLVSEQEKATKLQKKVTDLEYNLESKDSEINKLKKKIKLLQDD